MAYPSLEQYNEALQSPQLVLMDPELRLGQLKKTGMGLPLALCGGFALTYTVTVAANKKFALRCFHKESRELEQRYQAISARLKQLSNPYFLPFEFNPNGIRIQGKTYPIVKMEWAKGRTLAEFLEAEHHNPSALQKLRQALASLASFLERNHLAHGDIQPENVMVSGDGNVVQLIDYDGLYVEALKGSKASELGQINFQHPKRSASDFGPTLDRFSFLTLDVALQALIASPKLWSSSRSEPSAVVFRRNDFLNPAASSVFQEVVVIPSVRAHVENLAKVATGNFLAIPSLDDFLQGKGVPQGNVTSPRISTVVDYQGPYVVCNAVNYSQVLQMVGSRIELVGRIHSLKKGWAQNRKPYMFVNFSDWRGQAVKLTIWSDGMDLIKPNLPDESWIGRWVSVTGLVEPPYRNQVGSVSYTHLSITITTTGQIQELHEKEAKFRLGVAGKPIGNSVTPNTSSSIAPTTSRNASILQSMSNKHKGTTIPTLTLTQTQTQTQTPTPASPRKAPQTSNLQILENMNREQIRKPMPPPHVPVGTSQTSRSSPSPSEGCLPLLIGAAVLLLLVKGCTG